MKNKQEILAEIQEGLAAGVITKADLATFVGDRPAASIASPDTAPTNKSDKLSAVDIMFYIAGIVLFSAILSMIIQSWNDGNVLVHILLSAGVGIGLWSIAYYLSKDAAKNDIRNGLINSLLLTGSLSIVTGGYIITNEIVGGFGELNFIPTAVMLAVVGALHLAFDAGFKKSLVLLMGVLLCVMSFPALLFGILQDADVPMDIWSLVIIATAGLLAYATRIVAKINPDRQSVRNSFDSFAAFLALITMYISSYGEYGVLWLMTLIAGVFGIFYLSIITQNKHLLGNASFFLVLTVITISFKYFSGYGATTSLIIATIGLLGTAAVASSINKKYFKQTA